MNANELRGEFSIQMAQVAIEKMTECSLTILHLAAATKTLSLENAAIVVTECCRAQGRAINDQSLTEFKVRRVGEALYEGDLGKTFATIADLMAAAISGGFTASGEVKAGTLAQAIPADA
jgi:hypothetical protein